MGKGLRKRESNSLQRFGESELLMLLHLSCGEGIAEKRVELLTEVWLVRVAYVATFKLWGRDCGKKNRTLDRGLVSQSRTLDFYDHPQ